MPVRKRQAMRKARASVLAQRARPKRSKAPIDVPAPWRLEKGGKRIFVEVKTKDFVEAVDLILEIRDVAERLQHHPDLHLERWNRLRIVSYSHDVGHLTDRDERLAQRVADLLAKRGLA
jgi:4a-hydroxytetrahydrobiopterin dehydratase